jgi:branched-chain amino acid transport system ATP-binding protein
MTPLLEVSDLSVQYGAVRALRGVSFEVGAGETVAVIGANGAGKTTLMRALSGLAPVAGGTMKFDGARLADIPPHARARGLLLHIPEGRGVFGRMTVEDNLRLAWEMQPRRGSYQNCAARVFERFPRLRERRAQLAGSLSGGEQQMLALSRALVSPPRLLLVDEPSLGLSPLLTREVFKVLKELREEGGSILLVEQNVRSALALADRAYVLSHGLFTASGDASALAQDPAIVSAYLGEGKYSESSHHEPSSKLEENVT